MNDHFLKSNDIFKQISNKGAFIGGRDANFSEYFDLKRVAAHHFILPPGLRTSRPHAESLEDEFVFVINGEIDLWLNGRVKKMQSGDCIGFPAGTGIGHTFINNSTSSVELFVSGDRTKKDNKYRYHLEPELENKCGNYWWKDMPEQILGGHDGLPGSFDSRFIDHNITVYNAYVNIHDESFNYPGDSETFGNARYLSRIFKLSHVAINLDRLKPGKRSSWPHAHLLEEELAFILKGAPTICLNGETREVQPMTAINFMAGSGVAHTIINNTSEDVYYLCLGEHEVQDDKIYYPLHPKRNDQVDSEGWLWKDYPYSHLKLKHDGKPKEINK